MENGAAAEMSRRRKESKVTSFKGTLGPKERLENALFHSNKVL